MKYRLEFNEKTEGYQWHFEPEWRASHVENTYGWRTIASGQGSNKLSLFVDAVESLRHRLSYAEVLKLWTVFDAGYCRKFEPVSA